MMKTVENAQTNTAASRLRQKPRKIKAPTFRSKQAKQVNRKRGRHRRKTWEKKK